MREQKGKTGKMLQKIHCVRVPWCSRYVHDAHVSEPKTKNALITPATPIFPLASAFDMQISVCYEKSSQGGDNLTPTRFTTWHKQL